MDSFEELIEKNNRMRNNFGNMDKGIAKEIAPEKKNKLLTSEGTMDLFGFITMVNKIVTIAMKDMGVEFIPEENRIPIDNPEMEIDHPYITYFIYDQDIKDKESLKPRIREEIMEDPNDPNSRFGEIYGQKFQSIIQFNIFASVYADAEQVMKKFEELLFTYAGPLKKAGLGEILFKGQLTDTKLDQYRQTMSIRSVHYYIETENVITVFRNKIEEINIFGS